VAPPYKNTFKHIMAAGAMDYCYENPRMCFYMVQW
jgi:hypothetical protein